MKTEINSKTNSAINPKANLAPSLKETLVNFTQLHSNTGDIVTKFATVAGRELCILTCECMVNTMTVSTLLFPPLTALDLRAAEEFGEKPPSPTELMSAIEGKLMVAVEQNVAKTYEDLSLFFMSGFAIILVDGVDYALAIGAQGFANRGIQRPLIHENLRGSCEGFSEVLRFNIASVRRRVRSPRFITKITRVGKYAKTDVAILYFDDKVNKDMLAEVERRIEELPLQLILETGYIEPFLQNEGNSIFTQIGFTDRPDNLAAKLLDGRIAIMVEGTPFALFLPMLFMEHFQTMDDYSELSVYTSFIRVVKYLAFFICVLLPGFFVAATSFHPELFPPDILFNIITAEQKTPFAILTECVIVMVIFEIMREAGLRLPSVVGHAVSIVGGLVLGDIVISVGLISAPIVLIVAFSTIAAFVVPDLFPSITIMRILFVIAGGFFGLFGLTVVGAMFLFKVCSMSAYGVPFMAPLAPFTWRGMRDFFIRFTWHRLVKDDINLSTLKGVSNK
ncbi:MAG: spore germination protein [Oscillospiraceae bacterium]|nr:spore germination protein [Oscillospiraceae bacterium]